MRTSARQPTVLGRVGGGLASVVAAVAFVPLVLVPWIGGRLSGADRLWSPKGWVRGARVRPRADSAWRRDSLVRPWHRRVRRSLGVIAAMALLVGVPYGVGSKLSYDANRREVPAAFAGAAWYPAYEDDITWILGSDLYHPLDDVRVPQARTRYVNVVDGKRATWSAPACDCRRLVVWVYGGSTTWGLGQRDDHTIPSELARTAWSAGIALDVVNRGGLGDTHWDETRRFAWDLTHEAPPDLVIFYDGINEVTASYYGVDPLEPPDQTRERFWQQFVERFPLPDVDLPPGAHVEGRQLPDTRSPEAAGAVIAARYERSRSVSEMLADDAGVATASFWQPSGEHREPVAGEPPPADRALARARSDAILAALDPSVTDLTRVFDGVDRPLFYDGVHTNEEGARLVAAALFGSIRPTLDRLGGAAP